MSFWPLHQCLLAAEPGFLPMSATRSPGPGMDPTYVTDAPSRITPSDGWPAPAHGRPPRGIGAVPSTNATERPGAPHPVRRDRDGWVRVPCTRSARERDRGRGWAWWDRCHCVLDGGRPCPARGAPLRHRGLRIPDVPVSAGVRTGPRV